MKSVETKNKTERTRELIRGMDQAGKEIALAIESFKGLSLAAINMLLAGDEFFSEDLLEQLKDGKGILDRHYVETETGDEVVEDNMMEQFCEDDATAEESNHHATAISRLCDSVRNWPTDKIKFLSGYLEEHGQDGELQLGPVKESTLQVA